MKSHVYLIAADPFDPTVLYAATSFGVMRTLDGGAHWRVADRGLCGDRVVSLVIDAGPPSLLYVSTGGSCGGVFRTADRGTSWQKISEAGH
jgi:photosystem II stability/assembly factor-like uncharacterized protein